MLFFFLMRRQPPRSTLFPYTPLFRSAEALLDPAAQRRQGPVAAAVPALALGLEAQRPATGRGVAASLRGLYDPFGPDRKSTRLNSSHANISYAVFCLKKTKIMHLTLL